MAYVLSGASAPQHGMFFMESAGGYHAVSDDEAEEQHPPSCFGLEEEKGESWTGKGATRPLISEGKPTL